MSLPPACSATSTSRLSDSVYELYNPGVESVLDVVFFHGLQSSHTSVPHLSTWISSGSHKEVWPQTWIPQKFPGARILSVEYDASISTSPTHGRLDLYLTAESLMYNLIIAKVGQHPWRPVILVGHSYGGLVIKQLCVQAHFSESLHRSDKQIARFLNSVTGIFFYGTPHHGSSSFFTPNGTKLKDASPLLDYVKLLCAESGRLHEYFDALRVYYKWSIAGVGESRPTTFMLDAESQNAVAVSREMIVVEASARYGDFTLEHEDHISLCQPKSMTSNTYIRLTSFLQRLQSNKVNRRRLPDNLQTVPKMAMSLHSDLLVEVQNILHKGPAAVALCGMGGVGKTTLAKLLFNELCAEYEYTCFIPRCTDMKNTKEIEDKVYSSMHHLGKQLTQGVEKWNPTDLRQQTLLLVLDDIDNGSHVAFLQDIVSKNDCANSRYIVTCRDRNILNSLDSRVFDVKFLNPESSTKLFMSYAFPYPTEPSPSLKEWVHKIVAKCDGLPLTLEVIGTYLKTKVSESIWVQCFQALVEAKNVVSLDEKLWAKLRVSYDRLGSEEKEMFLDAASFFSKSTWNLREAKACWRVLYDSEDLRWQTLVDLSLVYNVMEEESIQMHEQLRSLGIRLASGWGTGGRCRTWTPENVPSRFKSSNFIKRIAERLFYSNDTGSSSTDMGTHIEEVIALRISMGTPKYEVRDYVTSTFKGIIPLGHEHSMLLDLRDIGQMKKLQYLDSEVFMRNEVGGKLPKNVTLLRLRGEVNILHNLVDRGLARSLAVLDLRAPLTCLPTTVSDFQNLEVMKFAECLFEGLPEAFGQLSRLRHLTFSCCVRLRSLPEAFGGLSQLRSLELHWCRSLKALPDRFGNLSQLQSLIIRCSDISKLPESFGNLSQLQSLIIYRSPISELPESFGNLSQLQSLEIDDSPISELPESFGNLSQLQTLTIYRSDISKLPESFGNLSQLQSLIIRWSDISKLPESFGNLSQLQTLTIYRSDISKLPESFGNLSQLQSLIIRWSDISKLPESFGNLSQLQTLEIYQSDISKLPESFGNLSQLQSLELSRARISKLPESFGNLSQLQSLEISRGKISELPESFGNLSQLQSLEISRAKISKLPESFGNLSQLQSLEISRAKISKLPESFGNLSQLQSLELSRAKISELPESFGNLSQLQSLEISRVKISELPESFGNLSQLQSLEISRARISKLPESFGNLSQLQSLEISRARISKLPESFGNLSQLQSLEIRWSDISKLPESFGNLSQLQSLEIYQSDISELPESFGDLASLRVLELGMCRLQALPDTFGQLSQLSHLTMQGCTIIQKFPESFGNLANLSTLDIINCPFLNYFGVPKSTEVDIRGRRMI
ncbi:protein SERAC1 [Marchantia polymorpha subsp. ruderalis]